jgi:competence protein ComEC
MKYLLLIILFAICLSSIDSYRPTQKRSYLKLNLNTKIYTKKSIGLARSSIAGDKSSLDRNIKLVLKRYGLLHLLTPSGLHLSSILIWSANTYFFIAIYFFALYMLVPHSSYNSMERVLIFKIINILQYKWKSISLESTFIITFIISFLIGHYQNSPYSYLFSLLFWGTILIFRRSKLKIIFYLNLSLYISSSLTGDLISPSSLVINPLLTLIYSTYFPILILSSISQIELLNKLNNLFLEIFIDFVSVISTYDPFPSIDIPLFTLLLFYSLLQFKYKKIAFVVLSYCSYSLIPNANLLEKSKVINLGHQQEILKVKKGEIYFIEQKCRFIEIEIFCKKKPSNYGGFQYYK